MIATFWILAGLMAIGVLLLLLPPLLRRRGSAAELSRDAVNTAVYREQLRELAEDLAAGTLSRAGYEEACRELEHRVLEDIPGTSAKPPAGGLAPKTAVAVGVALPILAFALYFAVGNVQVMLPGGTAGSDAQSPHGTQVEQIRAMVDRLAERMQQEPEDVEGWIMLGRSYSVLERFDDAARAYANAVVRRASDADLLADYADVLAMAQGRSMLGEPEKMVQRALGVDPRNIKSLALAGTAAFERQDYAGAVRLWERILEIAPAESELAQSVRGSIAEARALGAKQAAPAAVSTPATAAAGKLAQQPEAASVSGVVMLAPGATERVAPTDTLFVFARAVEGSRMPLAIIRTQAGSLPFKFTLDDSLAMTPGMRLSGHKQVVIGARISKSGNATPQAGDLEALTAPVAVGAKGVNVLIQAEKP